MYRESNLWIFGFQNQTIIENFEAICLSLLLTFQFSPHAGFTYHFHYCFVCFKRIIQQSQGTLATKKWQMDRVYRILFIKIHQLFIISFIRPW